MDEGARPAATADDIDPPFEVLAPTGAAVPLVFASPHSGTVYPLSFVSAARLDPVALRRSEDAFVDELFAAAPACGAPLLKARFPRAYVDPNREAFELDPAMFDEPLPAWVNTASPRVAGGLGTVAKVVTNGEEIYRKKLSFAEVRRRIEVLYFPYHAALTRLLEETERRFGVSLLIDCHSMPSVGGPMDADPGLKRVDFVLGDCHGVSCAPVVLEAARRALADMGFVVALNAPYSGGYTTRHYGRPATGRHALQIEINRALYMNEQTITRRPGFAAVADQVGRLVHALAAIDPKDLMPT
jgi:N-formylglutamate amidohydrolase